MQNNRQIMNKNRKLRKDGAEEWQSIMDELEANQNSLVDQWSNQPEHHFLTKVEWVGMITLRWEAGVWAANNEFGEQARKHFTRRLMENLARKKWRYRGRDKMPDWVAVEEFGKTGRPHHHIIISFDRALKKGLHVPSLGVIETGVRESVPFISDQLELPKGSVDLDWRVGDYGGYVSKVEGDRGWKLFIYSNDVAKMFPVERGAV